MDEIAEFSRCREDVVYFVETYCKIRSLKYGIMPFKLYDWQKSLLGHLHDHKNVIILKSRQVGATTVVVAFVNHQFIFFPNPQRLLILSASEEKAQEIMYKMHTILDHLPTFILGNAEVRVKARTKRPATVTFAHSKYNALTKQYEIFSESMAKALSTSGRSGAGETANYVVVDEMALMQKDEDVWGAIAPTVAHGGQMVIMSTPRGMNNQFARLWNKSSAGLMGGFVPMRVHYTQSGLTKADILEAIGEMPQYLWEQEFEMSFSATNRPVFNQKDLAACYRPLDERVDFESLMRRWIEYRAMAGISAEIADAKKEYQKTVCSIEESGFYFSGVDTSQGGSGDYNCIVTLNQEGIQVAALHSTARLSKWAGHFRENTDGTHIAVRGIVSQWHDKYPGLMVIEDNGPGQTVKNNYIAPEHPDCHVVFKTTRDNSSYTGVKSQLIMALQQAIEMHEITITDPTLYEQMQSFGYLNDRGRTGSTKGAYDDAVMALAWAWWGYSLYHRKQIQHLPRGQKHAIVHNEFGQVSGFPFAIVDSSKFAHVDKFDVRALGYL